MEEIINPSARFPENLAEDLVAESSFGYLLRGTARFSEERWQEGIADLEWSKKLDPNNPDSYWNLGIFYARNSPQKALIEYQRAALLFQKAENETMIAAAQREIDRMKKRLRHA